MFLISNKKIYWPLICFIVIAKFIMMARLPLDLDELNTINLLMSRDLSHILSWIRDYDTQLPLFYIFSKLLFPLLSQHELLLRIPSFIIITSAQFISFQYLKNSDGVVTARKFLLLTCLSFFLFKQSVLFRPYALLYFFATLAYINFTSSKKGFSFFISLLFLSLTHYFGLALSIVMLIFYFTQKKEFSLKIYLPLLIVMSLFLFIFGNDLLTDFLVTHTYRSLSLTHIFGEGFQLFSDPLAVLIVIYFIIRKKLFRSNEITLLLFNILIFIMCLVKGLFSTPIIEARYFVMALYPFYLLLAKHSTPKIFFILCSSSLFSFFFRLPVFGIHTKNLSLELKKMSVSEKSLSITSCDMTLRYYLDGFNDCYTQKLFDTKKVFYIRDKRSPTHCHCLRQINEDYHLMSKKEFINAEILSLEKKK